MTRAQLEHEIKYWQRQVSDLTAAMNAKLMGASSATLSSSGGSKSYTNYSVGDFKLAIAEAKKQVRLWTARKNHLSAALPRQVAIIRPGV